MCRISALVILFQPTLPHRERLGIFNALEHFFKYFNPRSRTGSDPVAPAQSMRIGLFQPTLPHRERREPGYTTDGSNGISTHAPAQGATIRYNIPLVKLIYFNPRSRTGSDRKYH